MLSINIVTSIYSSHVSSSSNRWETLCSKAPKITSSSSLVPVGDFCCSRYFWFIQHISRVSFQEENWKGTEALGRLIWMVARKREGPDWGLPITLFMDNVQ